VRETSYLKHLSHERDVVSDFLADLCNDGKWRREVQHTELVSGARGQAGATYRETLTWEGLYAPASLLVAEVERGSRLVVVAEDPGYRAVYEYAFTGSDGGTELRLFQHVETMGTVQLIEPFLWAMLTRWFERDLDDIDTAIAEDESRAQA